MGAELENYRASDWVLLRRVVEAAQIFLRPGEASDAVLF